MPKTYREVARILRRHGWRKVRQGAGSAVIWEAPDRQQTVSVHSGGKEGRQVPTGMLASLRRETGIEELR